MADLVITTPGNVTVVSGTPQQGTAGVAISAGDVIFRDETDSKMKLAEADNANAAVADAKGIATNSAGIGQTVGFLDAGDINLGITLVPGNTHILSGTPGKIGLASDLVSTWRLVYLGYPVTASVFRVAVKNTGFQKP